MEKKKLELSNCFIKEIEVCEVCEVCLSMNIYMKHINFYWGPVIMYQKIEIETKREYDREKIKYFEVSII